MQQPAEFTVPAAAVAPVLAQQRNDALDQVAQWQALAHQMMAERDQLAAEVEKLRADAGQ